MTQTPEEKLVELAKAYARHRKALRDNSQAFRDLYEAHPNYDFDLKSMRQDFIAEESDGGRRSIQWPGWLSAVNTVIGYGDHDEGAEHEPIRHAARLMDERKEINAQGIRIRNRLRIIGDQLLRAEP